MDFQLIQPAWKHYRVIHSKYPTENLFDDQNLRRNFILGSEEMLTCARLQHWRERVNEEDFRSGPGWGAVMASFCYSEPARFNSEAHGAYYCANSIQTALREWAFHSAVHWRYHETSTDASAVVRSYVGVFDQPLADLRAIEKVHLPDNYAHSQAYAQLLRADDSYGLVYNSVRHPGGLCAALLRPPATKPVKQGAHFSLMWNGHDFVEYASIGEYATL